MLAAFCLTVDGGRITAAKVAFGGMAGIPKRAKKLEELLRGLPLRSQLKIENSELKTTKPACLVNSARVSSPRMAALLLTGGRVVDPANRLDAKTDVLISEGKIAAVGADAAKKAPRDAERMAVNGLVVCPGLIDLHVHLREPGQTAKETLATGTAAAARGGFTSVVCMPNTSPAIDNAGTVALIRERAAQQGIVNVFVTGAISKGIAGEELAPIGGLKRAGIVAITDDGHCVQNNDLMRRACEYAKMFDLPVMDHCQDYALVTDGVMHEGYWSTVLGLRGWPSAGEEVIVARNILLAELTGAKVHCQHLSAAGSVALLREAKKRGVPISGEACPHHFTLTDAAVAGSEKFWATDGKTLNPQLSTLNLSPRLADLRHEFQNEPAVALRARPRGDSRRAWPTARLKSCAATTRRTAIMKRKWNSTTRRSASPDWKPNWRFR